MPKVTNKVSVYGDSMRAANPAIGLSSTAQRMRLSPKFSAGVNDFAVGGTSFYGTLRGLSGFSAASPGSLLWGGRDFQAQMAVDDCDIVVISLGGNDQPAGIQPGTSTAITNLGPGTPGEGYVGSDYLSIAADCLVMTQHARAAGKRPVLVGAPYMSLDKLLASGGGLYGADVVGGTEQSRRDMALGAISKVVAVNSFIRIVGGLQGVPVIVPYGSPIAPNMVPASSASVTDGVHHTQAYGHALSDWIGTEVARIFAL